MTTKELMVRLNQVANKNMGKVFYTLFLLIILESVFLTFTIFPAIMFLVSQKTSVITYLFSYACFFASIYLWLSFQFGFAIMLLRMTRNEYVTIGYIFLGFKKIRTVFPLLVSVGIILFLLGLASDFISEFILKIANITFPSEKEQAVTKLAIFFLIFLLTVVFIMIHFVFVFQIHFDEPSLSIPKVFGKSFSLMRKNCFKLFAFALKAGGRFLLIAIIVSFVSTFLSAGKSTGLSVLSFILEFVYFINAYTALIRIYFSIPVMYEELSKTVLGIEVNENSN